MADQLDELIREIAVKHGIAVARDDPILVLQTINNRLLQDSTEAQQAQLNRFQEEMEGISQRWQLDAKEKAERIITASLAAARESLDQILREGAEHATAVLNDALSPALVEIHQETRKSRRNSVICLLAAVLALASAIAAICY